MKVSSEPITFICRQVSARTSRPRWCSPCTAAAEKAAPWFDILDAHLADNDYVGGSQLTMGDIPAGSVTHRWMQWTPNRPPHTNLEAYYERLLARPAYQEHVVDANAPRTEQVQGN